MCLVKALRWRSENWNGYIMYNMISMSISWHFASQQRNIIEKNHGRGINYTFSWDQVFNIRCEQILSNQIVSSDRPLLGWLPKWSEGCRSLDSMASLFPQFMKDRAERQRTGMDRGRDETIDRIDGASESNRSSISGLTDNWSDMTCAELWHPLRIPGKLTFAGMSRQGQLRFHSGVDGEKSQRAERVMERWVVWSSFADRASGKWSMDIFTWNGDRLMN
jgi:hypothetical protein